MSTKEREVIHAAAEFLSDVHYALKGGGKLTSQSILIGGRDGKNRKYAALAIELSDQLREIMGATEQ